MNKTARLLLPIGEELYWLSSSIIVVLEKELVCFTRCFVSFRNVFLVEFDAETEAFDDNGFVKFVKDQVDDIYDMEEISEYGDVFKWECGFHNELYKLLKIK